MDTDADEEGESVSRLCERLVGHELGSDDDRLKDRAAHPALSLLVTDTV